MSGLDPNDCKSSLVHMLTLGDTSLYGQKSTSTYFTNRRGTTNVFEIVKLSNCQATAQLQLDLQLALNVNQTSAVQCYILDIYFS